MPAIRQPLPPPVPGRRLRWRSLSWRSLRPRSLWALPAALLLAGCSGSSLVAGFTGEVLHVVLVPTPGLEWIERVGTLPESWRRIERSFTDLHPDVRLRVTVVPESALPRELGLRQHRGLGPDLLLMRSPVAIAMLDRGLIEPLVESPTLRTAFASMEPASLARARTGGRLAGLPVYTDASLACYDRRRLARAPADLDELLAVAAAGDPIGLAVDPASLWWTAGSLGADAAMVPIITGISPAGWSPRLARPAIVAWLQWLRQASLQARVDLASSPRELVQGLEAGRLAWIPCFSPLLPRLDRSLGPHLGVAPLPSGPGGLPSPFTSLRVWSFGRDSTPRQRLLAEDLAALSLSPILQRSLTLASRSVLPVNRFVSLPVASSGQLAAMAAAEAQFRSGSPLLSAPFSADRVNQVLPPLTDTISQVMVGAVTPAAGADALLRLREPR